MVDDHQVVREGLLAIVDYQDDMKVVGEADNGEQAVRLWQELRPDVTLLDLRMPGMDGVSVIAAVRAIDPQARIVILTTYDGDEDVYRGMRAGASAYLLKDTRRDELLRCIRGVHAGETCVPPAIAAKLALQIRGERLTPRELQILKLMAEGVSNRTIGQKLFISEGTVKSHVKSIFEKLDVLSRTEAVALAAKRGLIRLS
ncbi:MAG TPA: response regulator transcription factor [Burkholderiales bacterium]|nr:response regulator transcription factor [Burkholderiales bacterium]